MIRLLTTFWLCFIFAIAAIFRDPTFGVDTPQYLDMYSEYFRPSGARFPDILFNSIATLFSYFSGGNGETRRYGGRLFLASITVLQAFLFFKLLRKKARIDEILVISIGFGPLIFFDIIRQGLAMVLSGYLFSRGHRSLLAYVAPAMIHVVALVSIVKIKIQKKERFAAVLLLSTLLSSIAFVLPRLADRYAFYARSGYLMSPYMALSDIPEQVSISNILVLIFFLVGFLLARISRKEITCLLILYPLSVSLPLFFRLYLFYIFLLTVTREFLSYKSLLDTAYSLCFMVLILRFSLTAF